MQWTIEEPGAWEATIKVTNPDFLDTMNFVAVGLGEPFGIPKMNINPETEIKNIVQYELALKLFKMYNDGKDFHEVIQDVINYYEAEEDDARR